MKEGPPGAPGSGIDADGAMAWRNTDVGKYLLQTPGTGVANWPSKATSLVGDSDWKWMQRGCRREYDYTQWAVRNKQESFRVAADVLKGSSTEFHASLRMNLFDGGLLGKHLNGKFWSEHPEMRKPGGCLDYAIPAVRTFIIGILTELANNYEVSGINMDFTRWPPVAWPARHDFSVLLNFIKEVRQSLDKVQAGKGRKLALSAHMVDAFYAGSLDSQKIDLDAWLATGVLDFISVETRHGQREQQLQSIAKRHGVPYYASQDFGIKGMLPDEDPAFRMSPKSVPGAEFTEQQELDRRFGYGMDPTDYDRGFAVRYAYGVEWGVYDEHLMSSCSQPLGARRGSEAAGRDGGDLGPGSGVQDDGFVRYSRMQV